MKKYDITILTDRRFVALENADSYAQNVVKEDRLLDEACTRLGLSMHRTNWDNEDFDWSTTKYVLFRTTWDYFDRFAEFSVWLERVQKVTKLINSKELIYWNLDKKYLIELGEKGVHIPPMIYIGQGDSRTLVDIAAESNLKQMILKPAVSGAARHTYKIEVDELAQYESIFRELIADENMLLQEFQEQIATKGEVSYMLFGGKFSHAVLKNAKPGDFRVQDDFGGTIQKYQPNDEEIAFSERALAQCPELPIYARVDVFWDNSDRLVLGELELIEPELWFRESETAADRCAAALYGYVRE